MKILLTNDDGVYARGIRILKEILDDVAEVNLVAPLEERSTTGHTLTLHGILRVKEIKAGIYGCSGFPADCSYWGLQHLYSDGGPDLVVSGINRGANLAQDVFYSGTVAGAREACIHGFKAIAVSSVIDFSRYQENETRYETAALYIKKLVENRAFDRIPEKTLMNVNVPDVPVEEIAGVCFGDLGLRKYDVEVKERKDLRNQKYYWIGGRYVGHSEIEGSDCSITEQNKIALTPVNLFMTKVDMPEGDKEPFLVSL